MGHGKKAGVLTGKLAIHPYNCIVTIVVKYLPLPSDSFDAALNKQLKCKST